MIVILSEIIYLVTCVVFRGRFPDKLELLLAVFNFLICAACWWTIGGLFGFITGVCLFFLNFILPEAIK